jgi:PAS domain S-box-containing protein
MTNSNTKGNGYLIKDKWYKTIVQTATEGFSLLDNIGKIVDVNDSYCNMIGYHRDELLSMSIQEIDIRFLDQIEVFEEEIRKVKKLGGIASEVQHKTKNGQIVDLWVSLRYLNTNPGFLFCFHRDITEKKRLQQQIIESEERYRALIEVGDRIGEAIVMLQNIKNMEGMQTFVSDEWCCITGYTREELLKMSFFEILHPSYCKDTLDCHLGKINGEDIPRKIEASIIRKDGKEIPIEFTSAFTSFHGKRAIVAYIREITERKKMETELKKYQENLEYLVKERTNKLEGIIKQRVEFNRALVHELKTPLTAIINSSELLTQQRREETTQRLAQNIFKGGIFLNNRIDELLDVIRSEVGSLCVNCKSIDPIKQIREAVEEMSSLAARKGQSIILNIPDELPEIWADKQRMQQVLLNLISNAIKFNSDEGRVIIRAREKDNYVIFEIVDEGKGISSAEALRLFEPYYRKESDRDHLSGLGLGLSLSKKLVELHNGKIWYKKRDGINGSIFGFSIPVSSTVGVQTEAENE